MPEMLEDTETCSEEVGMALSDAGVNVSYHNTSCDLVFCCCGIRPLTMNCIMDDHIFRDRVGSLARDCSNHGIAGCSKCLTSLYMFAKKILPSQYDMASSVDPLVVGRVIGDVVDMFIPSVIMSVNFTSKHVTNGCDIKPSVAAAIPDVKISGHSNDFYTLVMTDPDAPSPSEPSMREWVHWIVVDIPGGTNTNQGKEIMPYIGPRPPVGIHRYILVLFRQKSPLGLIDQPESRARFNTRGFAAQLDLGLPVATVYFNAQKETGNRRR